MLSLDFIRQNPDIVRQACVNKNRTDNVDKILELDMQSRELSKQSQDLRAQRNQTASGKPTPESIEQGKAIKIQLKELEERLQSVSQELDLLLLGVPNVPLPEVPIGRDENDNVVFKSWSEPKTFAFEAKDHIDLLEGRDLVELARGTKVSGFRGYFLKGKLAQLQLGLMMWAMQKLSAKGYTPLIAPSIVKGFTLFGNGQFPWGEAEVYKLNDEDAYLAGTAEVPVTALYSDETLSLADLPKKFVGFSPCFRREAGSHGKDTRGLYRVHEFWKIEQVIVCENDIVTSKKMHEELQANTESIWQDLDIPYRVLLMCTGDMGEPQVKKYDTEVWMPGSKKWAEVASNSIMTDFQSRRLNMKYKDAAGKTQYCHTLNNTAIASPRSLAAIVENMQEENGSIIIPEVLRPFVGHSSL